MQRNGRKSHAKEDRWLGRIRYITSLQAEQALALRLNDVNNTRWAKAELNLYLAEALRSWNALTATWVVTGPRRMCSRTLPRFRCGTRQGTTSTRW